jgi:hypothetical protein
LDLLIRVTLIPDILPVAATDCHHRPTPLHARAPWSRVLPSCAAISARPPSTPLRRTRFAA